VTENNARALHVPPGLERHDELLEWLKEKIPGCGCTELQGIS